MRIEFTRTGARVAAQWLGAERTVFEGSIFECIDYAARVEAAHGPFPLHNPHALGCKAATQDHRIISCEVCEVCES